MMAGQEHSPLTKVSPCLQEPFLMIQVAFSLSSKGSEEDIFLSLTLNIPVSK